MVHDRRVLRLWLVLILGLNAASAPAQTADSITVTAARTETRLADTPSSVVILSREVLQSAAGATVDDVLRQVPGFTLFRRTGSRVANPTTQGVSLRGIGGSGASRALVFDEGIPLNDPFGGWVAWGRIPRLSLERVEVLRGGASDLYGSAAMSGVVQFIRRRADEPALSLDASAGSQSTTTASIFAAVGGASLAIDRLDTAGYVLVGRRQRGPVDRAADVAHTAADLTFRRRSSFIRGSFYGEERNNGTPLQKNATTTGQLAAGFQTRTFIARGWGSDQKYSQTFSAVGSERDSERLTADQSVPSHSGGGSLQWSRSMNSRHAVVAGVEGLQVGGASNENQFAANGSVTRSEVSGRQRTGGAFIETLSVVRDLSVTAGMRLDLWKNYDGRHNRISLRSRSDQAFSPRLALLYRPSPAFALTASAYRAFRAPSLNELYRGFRVGNVVTLANESLAPERLTALELGGRMRFVRATVFSMRLSDGISNVTLSSTPALITRQRQNIAASRTRGLEAEGEWPAGPHLTLSSGYLFSDARVTAGDLAGRRLPQVPRHSLSAQIAWRGVSTLAMQSRWAGIQFDDDRNQFPLRGFFVADLLLSHPVGGGLQITLSVENLFDRRIEAGATPVITYGQPRSIRAGLRFDGGRRGRTTRH